jgi:hypothetical protein
MAHTEARRWTAHLAMVTGAVVLALAIRPEPALADGPEGSCDSSSTETICCTCRIVEHPPSDYEITECGKTRNSGYGSCQDGGRETGGYCHGSCDAGV